MSEQSVTWTVVSGVRQSSLFTFLATAVTDFVEKSEHGALSVLLPWSFFLFPACPATTCETWDNRLSLTHQ